MGSEATSYRRDGWIVLERALCEETVEGLRRAVDAHRVDVAPSSQILFTHMDPPAERPALGSLLEQWFNAHRRGGAHSTLPAVEAVRRHAADVLGASPVLFQDSLIVKKAGHAPLAWHQDFTYWPVDVPAGVVAWVPLDPVGEVNGGLVVASGSHEGGIGPAIDLHTGAPQPLHKGLVPETLTDTTLELAPGDLVLFHPLLWHRSGKNTTDSPRRAWSASWLHPLVRWARSRAPRHPLCSRVTDGALVGEVS
jgi:hypothetical protein